MSEAENDVEKKDEVVDVVVDVVAEKTPIDDKEVEGEDESEEENENEAEEALGEETKSTRMAGFKEGAKSLEGMLEAKKEDVSEEEKISVPSFFVDPHENHDIEVDILFSTKDGKIKYVSKTGLGINFDAFNYLGHTKETFTFSQPTYEDLSSYRQKSMIFSGQQGRLVVDPVKMRNYFMVFHLKDWTLKEPNGDKVELSFDEGSEALNDASLDRISNIFPTLMDVVLTLFENEVVLD